LQQAEARRAPGLSLLVLYPERQIVSEEKVRIWASDSYYNNADSYRCCACGRDTLTVSDCLHEGEHTPVYKDGSEKPETLVDCIDWLSDTGEVTFARQSEEASNYAAVRDWRESLDATSESYEEYISEIETAEELRSRYLP